MAQNDDPIKKGSIEIGGVSSLNFSRASFSVPASATDNLQQLSGGGATSNNSTSATVFVLNGSGVIYLTPKVGVGGSIGLLHFAIPATADTGGSFTTTAFSGLAKIRFPMKGKKDFYVEGAGGAVILSSGGSVTGPYFSGGAGIDIFMNNHVAFLVGAQYAFAHFNGLNVSGITVAAGMLVALR